MNIKHYITYLTIPLLSLLVLTSVGHAAKVADLYAAEAFMKDESAEARNKALSVALAKILVRLSGNSQINSHAGASKVTAKASSLVQQFKFRVEEVSPEVLAALKEGEEPPKEKRFIWAKFDKSVVDRMMRQNGLPVWGAKQRPQVLLWLSTERNGKRRMASLEGDVVGRKAVNGMAQYRGMPLQLPLMDLEDQSALRVSDLWSDFTDGIRSASARYPHDVVLTAKLKKVGNSWRSTWVLFDKDVTESFDLPAQAWSQTLAAGIAGAQDRLAEHYAPIGDGSGPERLRVLFKQVDSVDGLGRLYGLLRAQESISRFVVAQVTDDWMLMDVWVSGGRSALSRGLALGGDLFEELDNAATHSTSRLPIATAAGGSKAATVNKSFPVADMTYRLQP